MLKSPLSSRQATFVWQEKMNRIALPSPSCSHHIPLLRSFFTTTLASTIRHQTVSAGNKAAKRSRSGLAMDGHGDLNNSHAARATVELAVDPADRYRSLAIQAHEDDAAVRQLYRPFILPEPFAADDWVAQLELGTTLKMVESETLGSKPDRLRILVLYGSLRNRYVLERAPALADHQQQVLFLTPAPWVVELYRPLKLTLL